MSPSRTEREKILSNITNFILPFQVIQVSVCGVVLVSYPLAVFPAPVLSLVGSLLLFIPPLLSLVEGYQIYLLVTKLSRYTLQIRGLE